MENKPGIPAKGLEAKSMEKGPAKARARRRNGQGSVSRKPNSKGYYTLTICRDYRKKVLYFHSQREAEAERKRLANQEHVNLGPDQPLASFLGAWLASVRGTVKPSTYTRYEQGVKNQLIPWLGHHRLTKLTRQQVQAALYDMTDPKAAKAIGRKPVSEGTANSSRILLGTALESAVLDRVLTYNVARECKPLSCDRRESYIMPEPERERFFAAAETDPLGPAYIVGGGIGLREGELLGLTWQDIDQENRVLYVKKQRHMRDPNQRASTKRKASVRIEPIVPRQFAALERQHALQASAKLKAGELWGISQTTRRGKGEAAPVTVDYVFTTANGTPYTVRNFYSEYQKFLLRNRISPVRENGQPVMTFHDLRANLGTALAPVTDLKTSSEILGHADPRTTQRFYTTTNLERKRAALEAVNR
jgi:integrase